MTGKKTRAWFEAYPGDFGSGRFEVALRDTGETVHLVNRDGSVGKRARHVYQADRDVYYSSGLGPDITAGQRFIILGGCFHEVMADGRVM